MNALEIFPRLVMYTPQATRMIEVVSSKVTPRRFHLCGNFQVSKIFHLDLANDNRDDMGDRAKVCGGTVANVLPFERGVNLMECGIAFHDFVCGVRVLVSNGACGKFAAVISCNDRIKYIRTVKGRQTFPP